MNFDLTDEQSLLQDSVARYVADHYDLETRNKLAATSQGWSDENWNAFAELGWLALPFAETDGGFGGTQIETMLLMEQFGKGLVVEPYLSAIVLGGGSIARSNSPTLKAEILPGIQDGSTRLALGWAEEQSRFDLDDVVTSARADGAGYVLNGHKSMVANAETATHLVVSARTSGGQKDENGITLFLVDAADAKLANFPTVDGLRASEVALENVALDGDRVIGKLDGGYEILNAVANDAMLALGAEAIGCMEVLYKDTVEYTQQREQFDHPLADFQVLQHRMVDMFMEFEQCRSLLYRATLETAQGAPTAQRTVHALKHLVGKAASFIGESAVQLHGGMGVTEELRVGHYFKRLLVIETQFGNTDYHLAKFAA